MFEGIQFPRPGYDKQRELEKALMAAMEQERSAMQNQAPILVDNNSMDDSLNADLNMQSNNSIDFWPPHRGNSLDQGHEEKNILDMTFLYDDDLGIDCKMEDVKKEKLNSSAMLEEFPHIYPTPKASPRIIPKREPPQELRGSLINVEGLERPGHGLSRMQPFQHHLQMKVEPFAPLNYPMPAPKSGNNRSKSGNKPLTKKKLKILQHNPPPVINVTPIPEISINPVGKPFNPDVDKKILNYIKQYIEHKRRRGLT